MMATSDTTSDVLGKMLTVREYCIKENAKCTGKEKTLEKKRHQILNFKASDLLAIDTTGRRTWQSVNSKRRLQRIQILQEGKRHFKKDTSKF